MLRVLFLLHATLIDATKKIMNAFWWGHGGATHRGHWLSWDKLTIDNFFKGMGFKYLTAFN